MRFVIVTGMSGAGKSTALKMLEDAGYFCVDNLPMPLVDKFAELASGTDQEYSKVALGLDVRSIHEPRALEHLLAMLDENRYAHEILFLEAGNPTLVKRYKETRRSHPLSRDGRVSQGIDRERQILAPLKVGGLYHRYQPAADPGSAKRAGQDFYPAAGISESVCHRAFLRV